MKIYKKMRMFIQATSLWLVIMMLVAVPLVAADQEVDKHVVGDDVIDTPIEVDEAHHAIEDQHGGPGGHLPASSLNGIWLGKSL